jgi:hypothetical protein
MNAILATLRRRAGKAAGMLLWLPVILLPASMLLPFEHCMRGEFHLNVHAVGYYAETMTRTWQPPTAFNTAQYIGLPNPVFYGPLLFRVLGLLGSLFHPALAVRIAAVILFAAQFCLVRRALLRWGSGQVLAGVVACLTIWTLYPLTNLYNRGAHGEFFAVGFLTCAVALWFTALAASKVGAVWRHSMAFAFCCALTAGSHAITALWSLIPLLLLGPTLLYHRRAVPLRLRLGALVAGMVLALLVLSSWIYAVRQFHGDLGIQQSVDITETSYDMAWLRFFPLPLDPVDFAEGNSRRGMNMQINLPLLLVVVTGLALAARARGTQRSAWRLGWLALPVVLALATFYLSGRAALFRQLPEIASAVQFPYRLISCGNLLLLLAVFYLVLGTPHGTSDTRLASSFVSPVVLAIAVTLSGSALVTKLVSTYPVWIPSNLLEWIEPFTSTSEVRQKLAGAALTVAPRDYATRRRFRSLQEEGIVPEFDVNFACDSAGDEVRQPGAATVHLPRPGYLLTNVLAFPWNRFRIDGEPVDSSSLRWGYAAGDPATGPVLAVPVPAGTHRLETRLEPDRTYRVLAVVADNVLLLWSAGLVGVALWKLIQAVRGRAKRTHDSSGSHAHHLEGDWKVRAAA